MAATFDLKFTPEASEALDALAGDAHLEKKLKKVRTALGRLSQNPRHPGHSSHKYSSMKGIDGSEVFDSYVENNTPSAWRIFWQYGPGAKTITVLSITSHP